MKILPSLLTCVVLVSGCKLEPESISETEAQEAPSIASPEYLAVVENNITDVVWLSLLKDVNGSTGACLYHKRVHRDLSKVEPKIIESAIESAELVTTKMQNFSELMKKINIQIKEEGGWKGFLTSFGMVAGSTGALAGKLTTAETLVIYEKGVGNIFRIPHSPFDPTLVRFEYSRTMKHLASLRGNLFEEVIGAWDQVARVRVLKGRVAYVEAPFTHDVLMQLLKGNTKQIQVVFDDGIRRTVQVSNLVSKVQSLKGNERFAKDLAMYLAEAESFEKKVVSARSAVGAMKGLNPHIVDEILESETLALEILRKQKNFRTKVVFAGALLLGASTAGFMMTLPTQSVSQKDLTGQLSKKITRKTVDSMINAGSEWNFKGEGSDCPTAGDAWKNILRYRYKKTTR